MSSVLLAACSVTTPTVATQLPPTAPASPTTAEGSTSVPPLPPTPLVWQDGLADGDLSKFKSTPWNRVGGPPPEIVDSPAPRGDVTRAIKISIDGRTSPGDGICCGSRNEIEPNFPDLKEGDDYFFAFSTYLDPGFPTADGWQTIMQFKQNGDGSPPLSMDVMDGVYRISGGYGHPDGPKLFYTPLAQASSGEWVDWVFHVAFSTDPNKGLVEVWKDGQPVVQGFRPEGGTVYPRSDGDAYDYLKIGYYRDYAIAPPGTIYFARLRIGRTFESVSA